MNKLYHNRNQPPELESLRRLHQAKKPLTELASDLARGMNANVPANIEVGKLYQLSGKALHGVDALILLVIPDHHALVIDLTTGVVATVDKYGVSKTAFIGARQ